MQSFHHKYLETLSIRRRLSDQESRYLAWMQRGYEGELLFSQYLQQLPSHNLLIKEDLHLKFQKQTQIDAMIICDHSLFVFEIKNYATNIRFDGKDFLMGSGKVLIDNPLVQLKRSSQIVKNIVHEFSPSIEVRPYLVFVNPDQTVDLPASASEIIIRSYEIKQFLENLIQKASSGRQANQLASHIEKYQFEERIHNFSEIKNNHPLEKGLYCLTCHSFHLTCNNQFAHCSCGQHFPIKHLISKTIEDYCILYPEENLTVTKIYRFLDGQVSRPAIRRVLNQKLARIDNTNKPFYYRNPYYLD